MALFDVRALKNLNILHDYSVEESSLDHGYTSQIDIPWAHFNIL
jgi:hypothetical protein